MKTRGSARELIANLRRPLPLGVKLGLLLRNRWLALVRGGCCGHPGEVGC